MDNDFHNDTFGKIVVKIFVVCEGLKVTKIILRSQTHKKWVPH